MADLQSRYQAVPYGWKEIDIAAVVAKLVYDQKVTIKYGGAMIRPENPKLVDMLRKKSETSKAAVGIHISPTVTTMRAAKELLRDYFDVMDVPDDENGLVDFIIQRFTERQEHYQELKGRYVNHNYPDQDLVPQSIIAIQKVLAQKKDNIALINALLAAEDELFECKEQMQRVEEFFKNSGPAPMQPPDPTPGCPAAKSPSSSCPAAETRESRPVFPLPSTQRSWGPRRSRP